MSATSQPTISERTPPAIPLADDAQLSRLLVQGVTDYAIYMLDPDGFICNWNTGGQRIKGYDGKEIIGQHFSRFYTKEDRDAGEPAHGLLMARLNGRHEKEGWRLRKDGSRFWAHIVIDPIWQDDRLIGFAKIARDITERREARRRLEEAQRALARSQRIEAVGKLTLGLSHDFNNLLGVIVNSLDLIMVHRDDVARTAELVEVAMRAAERGSLLTRQLLAFAKGQPLAPERSDINALLLQSKELYARTCGPEIQLQFDLAEELPQVMVDTAQFEAAVLNLVANGRDAMAAGGQITIRTLAMDTGDGSPDAVERAHACVVVSDTGEGMSDGVLERAVEPFFTTKEVGKGSGLGLSQVHGFAAQSGGVVRMESEVGKGTSITICLPAAD
jgi:PAS domain S-box-containing protein